MLLLEMRNVGEDAVYALMLPVLDADFRPAKTSSSSSSRVVATLSFTCCRMCTLETVVGLSQIRSTCVVDCLLGDPEFLMCRRWKPLMQWSSTQGIILSSLLRNLSSK